jgi:hypothetical protein
MRYYVDSNMTEKHTIPTSADATKSTAPHLPDRSDLSKLYFTPKEPVVTVDEQNNALDQINISETIRTNALKIGLLVPLPFIITIGLSGLLLAVVTPSMLYLMLPFLLVWGIGMTIIVKKITKQLSRIDVPVITFLSLHISGLLLVTPLVYHAMQSVVSSSWIILAMVSLVMTLLSIGISWVLLQLIMNDFLSHKTKSCLVVLIMTFCVGAATTYLLLQ